jgi:hypothetical protein
MGCPERPLGITTIGYILVMSQKSSNFLYLAAKAGNHEAPLNSHSAQSFIDVFIIIISKIIITRMTPQNMIPNCLYFSCMLAMAL